MAMRSKIRRSAWVLVFWRSPPLARRLLHVFEFAADGKIKSERV
jgi:hypothetical protein